MTAQDWRELYRSEDAVLRGKAAEGLDPAESDAAEAIELLLRDGDPVVRFKMAVTLARRGDGRGLEALLWGLGKPDLCFMALDALAELADPGCLPAVRRLFGRAFLHPLERLMAAAVMHRCGDTRGSRHLERGLKSRRPEVRGLALELWGRFDMPGAFDMLYTIAVDPSEPHRLDALRGLGWIGGARCRAVFERLAGDEDEEVAALARWYLEGESDE